MYIVQMHHKCIGSTDVFQLVVYYVPFMVGMAMMRLLLGGSRTVGASGEGGVASFISPRIFWRILGAVIMGLVLARWSWILFAPHSEAVFVAPEQEASTEAGRLFGVVPVATVAAPVGVALPNVRLLGVFAGSPGFAVLELDGKRQKSIALSDEVAPGTRLLEVAADYVVLEHGGVRQRVDLEGQAAALASAKAAMVPGASAKPGS